MSTETTPNTPPAIYGQMIAIMKEVGPIGKDHKSAGKFSFAYRGIDQVYAVMQPLFAKHGVFIVSRVLDHTNEWQTTTGGTEGCHQWVKMKFQFVSGIDGSMVCSTAIGESWDAGDKGVNKCTSIALKYAMFQTFLIPTEELADPDATNHELKGPLPSNMTPVSGQTRKSPPEPRKSPPAASRDVRDTTDLDPTTWTFPFGPNKGRTLPEVTEEDPDAVISTLRWMEDKYNPGGKYAVQNKATIEMIQDWVASQPAFADSFTQEELDEAADQVPF